MIISARKRLAILETEYFLSSPLHLLDKNQSNTTDSSIIDCPLCNWNNSRDMASLPQAAFCVAKLREKSSHMKVSRLIPKTEDARAHFSNKKLMEYTPVKYNGKMMNSIWGSYNRFSPHNIKKICDGNEIFNTAPLSSRRQE